MGQAIRGMVRDTPTFSLSKVHIKSAEWKELLKIPIF